MVSNLATYDLATIQADTNRLYGLGEFLLPEMAAAFHYDLPDLPSLRTLEELTAAVAPHKELQRNIEIAKRILGPNALNKVIDWVERSGAMDAVAGSFVSPGSDMAIPNQIDLMTWSGGVANWQLRRVAQALEVDPKHVLRVVLPLGMRVMGDDEHELVEDFSQRFGEGRLTEWRFAERNVLPKLYSRFDAEALKVKSTNGDEIWDALFREYPFFAGSSIDDIKILVIGNAPNTVQAAAQVRAAARRVNPTFDQDGNQLFMRGDSFPLAHHGEHKSTHQNPWSAIGQVLRLYKLLLEAAFLV